MVDAGCSTKRCVDYSYHLWQCALSLCTTSVVSYRSTLTFLVTAINLAGVRFLGEVEFWLSSVKIIALIGLILFGIFVDAGVNPKHDIIGFRYYRPPYGPFGSYLENIVGVGNTSRFLGVCSVMSMYFGFTRQY